MSDFNKMSLLTSYQDAVGVLASLRSMYTQMKRMQTLLVRYSDPAEVEFRTAVDTIFTESERGELGTIITKVNTLVTDLETNHSIALGI